MCVPFLRIESNKLMGIFVLLKDFRELKAFFLGGGGGGGGGGRTDRRGKGCKPLHISHTSLLSNHEITHKYMTSGELHIFSHLKEKECERSFLEWTLRDCPEVECHRKSQIHSI